MAVDAPTSFNERSLLVLRNLDAVLVVIAMAPAVALGAPVFGYAIGAGAWILQRLVAATDKRWLVRVTPATRQLGVSLFEAFARIWLLAAAIVVAGTVGTRADGLTAALVIFGAYSVAFAVRVISGPPGRREVP